MKAVFDSEGGEPVSEMAIVDTFTRLIFGAQDGFSSSDELIIQALRVVDASCALDDYSDLGEYLRALGVAEMIELVTRVQANLAGTLQATATVRASSNPRRRASR
jgi:hypothetical protein